MRVLLINPPQDRAVESEAGGLPLVASAPYPPLGLAYLQAALLGSGRHEAEVLDANLPGVFERWRAGEERLSAPDVVGVTALTPNLPGVVAVVAAARRNYPGAHVVVGGPHVDLFPVETAGLEGVDFALQGEAEETLVALLDSLEAGRVDRSIAGLYTAESERPAAAPRGPGRRRPDGRPVVADLDALSFPDRALLGVERYTGFLGRAEPFATMVTSRGCPHRCTFCSTPGGYRLRSVESVVEELERCAHAGIGHVYFLDDTFPVSGRRLDALCTALGRHRRLPTWSCRTAAAGLSAEKVRAMKRVGCQRIQIGVETGTDEGLRCLGKATTVDEIRRTFESTRRAGMGTVAYFMLGLPTERTRADVRRLFRFARELGPTYAMFNILTLYPGTQLLDEAEARGLVRPGIWREFAERPSAAFVPPVWEEHLDRAALVALLGEAYRSFYLHPRTVLRLVLEGGLRRKARAAWELVAGALPGRR